MPTASPDGPQIDRWTGGLTWIAHPDETMARASHALVGDDGVWLVDPLDATDIDEAVSALGPVAGVVVLIDRHTRDAGTFAARHDVAVHAPSSVATGIDDLDVPVVPVADELGDTGYRARPVVTNRFWREAALVSAGGGTALVPEALGTAAYYLAPGERVGVSPALRLWPPRRQLGDLDPERLLVGHGPPVLDGAGDDVRDALAAARRRAPGAYWRATVAFLTG